MSPRLLNWLLAGALAASLALHAADAARPREADPEPAAAAPGLDLEALQLSDAQLERLRDACGGCCGDRVELDAEIERTEADLRAALATPSIDASRVRTLAAELGRLRGERLQNGVDSVLLVRDVLEPAQVDALIECFERCNAPVGQ